MSSFSNLSGEVTGAIADVRIISGGGSGYVFEISTYNEDFFIEIQRSLNAVIAAAPESWFGIYGSDEWSIKGSGISNVATSNPTPYLWQVTFVVNNTGAAPAGAETGFGIINRAWTEFDVITNNTYPYGPFSVNSSQLHFFIQGGSGGGVTPPLLVSDPKLLPAPLVKLRSGYLASATTATGDQINSTQAATVTLADIPLDFLTNSAYKLQLELVRWKSRTTRVNPAIGRYSRSSGWVHPTHYVVGASGGGGGGLSHGTRFGDHSRVGDANGFFGQPVTGRPSEWPLTGMGLNDNVTLSLSETFGGWFRAARIFDAVGNGITAYTYINGRTRLVNSSTGNYKQVGNATNIARFSFRYSVIDLNTGFRVSGPLSEQFVVMGEKPLFIVNTAAYPVPGKVVNPDADYSVNKNIKGKLVIPPVR